MMAERRARTLRNNVGIRQQQRRLAFMRQEVFNWEEEDEINYLSEQEANGEPAHEEQPLLLSPVSFLMSPAREPNHEYMINEEDEVNNDDDEEYFSLVDEDSVDGYNTEEEETVEDFDDCWQHADQLPEEEQNAAFQQSLIDWVMNCNVTQSAVDRLLKVMRSHHCFGFLPKTYRTLIKTPREVEIREMEPGQYFHAGFRAGLIGALEAANVDVNSLSAAEVFINIDGASLSDSSPSDMWFILARMCNIDSQPFEIGLYHGKTKPSNFNDFLREFVLEANQLVENGLEFKGKIIRVEIHCFTCDAPALASIKFIKQHGGFCACTKCEVNGLFVHNAIGRGGRVTYPEVNAPLRSHESFVEQAQPEHHDGRSILENLRSISMVNSFTIDPFHLVFIGVVAKVLHLLVKCRRKIKVRVLKSTIDELSNYLVDIKTFIPVEFARKTRSLKELGRYKATEFRLLLLYILPVALSLMPQGLYDHFLLLHCAIRILSCPRLVMDRANVEYARTLLVNFVTSSPTLYGYEFLVYNVHNLIHLADEVLRFGPLDVFSAAPFENHIGVLTNLVQPTNRQLAQLAKRLIERRNNGTKKQKYSLPTGMFQTHRNGPTLRRFTGTQYQKLFVNKMRLSIQTPNNCVILTDNQVFEIDNFVVNNHGGMQMIGRILPSVRSLFSYPMDSLMLGEVVVNNSPNLNLQCVDVSLLKNKAVKIPLTNSTTEFAIIPFLHVDY